MWSIDRNMLDEVVLPGLRAIGHKYGGPVRMPVDCLGPGDVSVVVCVHYKPRLV
jgi:hypothetical protein